ncbi:MAG: hypothetical protein ACI906_003366 [Candidatus Latescibacterota bacterium]|jgi:hypothetical protein
MDKDLLVLSIIIGSALPLYVIAYLIKVKKNLTLIAGFNPALVADPEGMAHWVGSFCFLIASAVLLMGAGHYFLPEHPLHVALGGVLLISGLSIAMIIGLQRFAKKDTAAREEP